MHALLLSLQLDGEGPGWLGISLKFRERRAEVPSLRVTLARPALEERPLEPPQEHDPPVPRVVVSATSRAKLPSSQFSAISPGEANAALAKDVAPPKASALPRPPAPLPQRKADSEAPTTPPADTVAKKESTPAQVDDATKPVSVEAATEPILTAEPKGANKTFAIPTQEPPEDAAHLEATKAAEKTEAERKEAERATSARLDALRAENERKEQARIAAAKVESLRQEASRQEAERLEAARIEAARLETLRAEAKKAEAARQEAARQEAQRLEALRAEAQRQEAARVAAARIEAQRLEAARRESERLEVARQAAAKIESARMQEERDEDARREARRRNMARILEEEAAQRDNAKFATSKPILPLSLSSARRVRLWGRADPNEELVKYAETWARRIQLNTLPEVIRGITRAMPMSPMVTVAVRSDGTIESVNFVVSSGAPDVDEAIRRIVHSHAPYPPFPPELSRDFDVVEIRRTWIFDVAVRLQ